MTSTHCLSTTHECDKRQTDRAVEKCAAIGGIAGARAIPPNKVKKVKGCL